MNRNKLVLFLLLITSTFCSAQEAAYSYRRPVSNLQQEGWYSIALPSDIFAHVDSEFRDLRFFSINGTDTTEIPYVLDIQQTEIRKTEVALPVINKSKKDGVLFLGFELAAGQKVNFIDLGFEETNFFGMVKIEGSSDKKEWFEIADQQRIFSIQNNNEQYKNGVISFPVTDYRFLRISVKSDTPLTFTSATFLHQEIKEGIFETIPLSWKVQEDKKAKKTIADITFDHYRPLSSLKFDFTNDRDFYRSAEVAIVTDSVKTEKGWIKNYQSVYSGFVTSFNTNLFDLGFHLAKEVRLTFYNYDNTPLTIKEITASGASVELKAQLKPQPTFLFYGNRLASRPAYDIDYFKEKIPAKAPYLTLGSEELLIAPTPQSSALFENKFWLWAIMIAVIGVLGFFTLRMMKGKESSSTS